MKMKDVMTMIYDNYEVFHTMCFSSTLVSTYNSKASDYDSHKIITFIGEAFKIREEMRNEFANCILGDMMNIGLITDYHALSSAELLSDYDKENIELYEIKGHILEEIAVCEAQNYVVTDVRIANQIRTNMKYEYFHHPYNAQVRFEHLVHLSESGNVNIIRQVGILYALGIGCKTDFHRAEKAFLKCILWGDKISAMLLNRLHYMKNKEDMGFESLYLALKNETTSETNKLVWEYYNLIKMLKAFIIAPKKDPLINHELANVLISNELTYRQKVELVTNFNERAWKHALLFSDNKENRIGFRVRKNE